MRASIPILAAAVALAGAASGCGEDDDCCAPPSEPPASPIAYSVSGGYPPFASRLRIDSDGSARLVTTAYDEPRRKVRFDVPESQLTAIRERLTALEPEDLPKRGPGVTCADCPLVELTYGDLRIEIEAPFSPPELATVLEDLDRLSA